MTPEEIREELAEINPEAMLADGLENGLVGWCRQHGSETIALYDYDLCVEVFVDQGMTRDEAVEWMDFNVTDAYVGPHTPSFAVIRRSRVEKRRCRSAKGSSR